MNTITHTVDLKHWGYTVDVYLNGVNIVSLICFSDESRDRVVNLLKNKSKNNALFLIQVKAILNTKDVVFSVNFMLIQDNIEIDYIHISSMMNFFKFIHENNTI